jgi:hypothetical protein
MKKIIWATGRNYKTRFGENQERRLDLHRLPSYVPFVPTLMGATQEDGCKGFKTMN